MEPYTYSWETEYKVGQKSYGASFFLDDTSIANPKIIKTVPNLSRLKFKLKVKDSMGTEIADSIIIRFSVFVYTMVYFSPEINEGDTIMLPHNIGGGIEPLSFLWTPNYNISDSSESHTMAWPDTSTTYQVIATDSVGCMSMSENIHVTVNPLNVSKYQSELQPCLFPNPGTSNSVLLINTKSFKNLEIVIFSLNGQLILQDKFVDNTYQIGKK